MDFKKVNKKFSISIFRTTKKYKNKHFDVKKSNVLKNCNKKTFVFIYTKRTLTYECF